MTESDQAAINNETTESTAGHDYDREEIRPNISMFVDRVPNGVEVPAVSTEVDSLSMTIGPYEIVFEDCVTINERRATPTTAVFADMSVLHRPSGHVFEMNELLFEGDTE